MASMPAVAVDASPDQFTMFGMDIDSSSANTRTTTTHINVNDNVRDQDLVEARIAALGYLCDTRTLVGNNGHDTYYLVGDASHRLVWSRWDQGEQGNVLSVERHDGTDWRIMWHGSIAGFLCDGPDVDSVSPVKHTVRQLGLMLTRLKQSRADTFCHWDGNSEQAPAQSMVLRVSSLDPTLDGRKLRVNRTTQRCHLLEDGNFVNGVSLSELFANKIDENAEKYFKSFLKTPSRASSGKTIATVWKSLRDAVATFLTNR